MARGLFTEQEYEAVRDRLAALLDEAGAHVDATYMCPHHPEFGDPCECRKPGTLLYRRAAARLDLDFKRSWFVGDKFRDVLPARELGGRAILVPGPATPEADIQDARREFSLATSLEDAAARITRVEP